MDYMILSLVGMKLIQMLIQNSFGIFKGTFSFSIFFQADFNNFSSPGKYTYVAELLTPNVPAYFYVERFSAYNENPSLVALTSECFARYLVSNMLDYNAGVFYIFIIIISLYIFIITNH